MGSKVRVGATGDAAAVVRCATDAIFTTDQHGWVTAWNPGAERLYGYPEAQAIGQRAWSLLSCSPGEADPFIVCAETGKAVARHLALHRRADGTETWTSLSLSPVPDGPVFTVVAIAHDASEQVLTQRSLAASEAKFRLVAENATDVISLFSYHDGPRFEYVSPSSTEVLGRTPEEYYADPEGAINAVHPDDAYRVVEEITSGKHGELTRIARPDGSVIWVEIRTRLFDAGDGSPGLAMSVTRDVTDRVEAERALRLSEERHRTIVETMQEGIWVSNDEGEIVFANARMGEILGRDLADLLGRGPFDFIPPEQLEQARAERQRIREGVVGHSEFAVVRPDGTRRWVLVTSSPLKAVDGRPAGVLSTVGDITERKEATEQLAHLALHDSLTGLPNRVLFLDRLEQANGRAARAEAGIAVLFLDVDHFKLVNDSLGHAAGDDLLRGVAERLSAAVRPGDTVARLGGDEFAVLCEGIDEAEAMNVADRLLRTFDDALVCGPAPQFLSASIGIAIGPVGQAAALVRDADTAMYRAKDQGRARYAVYDAGLRLAVTERLQLTNELRCALDDDQLVVYYQPIVELSSGEVVAAEALLRWNHPHRGMLGPAEFIPVAEVSGLIVPIGKWVLRQACEQAAAWRRQGFELGVSVNLSARQVAEETGVDFLARTLAETGLHGTDLMLEVTESAVLDDAARAERVLRDLKDLGVRIAIDDFGTGYSSLSYLRRFPVDAIKIDRSFVSGLLSEPDDETIVSAVIGLAENLGLAAIAEGVEDMAQLERLRALGCAYGQGFLWSRPVPPGRFEADLRVRGLLRRHPQAVVAG
jgi:diguanylate cyclase (GGDEF)-like protein/PAS domain S-box-containing protein